MFYDTAYLDKRLAHGEGGREIERREREGGREGEGDQRQRRDQRQGAIPSLGEGDQRQCRLLLLLLLLLTHLFLPMATSAERNNNHLLNTTPLPPQALGKSRMRRRLPNMSRSVTDSNIFLHERAACSDLNSLGASKKAAAAAWPRLRIKEHVIRIRNIDMVVRV